MEKLAAHSPSLAGRNVDAIATLFPSVITESRDASGSLVRAVDFDLLRQELAGHVVEGPRERYQLDWPGKRSAIFTADAPVAKTLRPVRGESVCFDTTRNLFIEGDNLNALKLLQESYLGKVALIYIDPPYNTGNDFVYDDDFAQTTEEYLARSGQADADGSRLVANTESNGRFHSDWLSMMYPRLKLARNLLAENGAIFVSIDSTEHANLTRLLTELMGESNFRASIVWQKRYTRSNNTRAFATVVESIVVFSRSDEFTVNLLPRTSEADARYANPDNDPRGPWKAASFLNPASPARRPNLCYPITNPHTGQVTRPTTHAWRRSRAEFERLAADDLLYWGADGRSPVPSVKTFLTEVRGLTPTNFWSHEYAGHTDEGTRDLAALIDGKVFDNPKPVKLLKRVLEHATDESSLVLDFFAGTGTMAQAVLELNAEDGGARRFIAVQLPEACPARSAAFQAGFATIADLGKERIRRAGNALRQAAGHPRWDADIGFRVLKVDSTNMTGVHRAPDHLDQADLALLTETAKPDRTVEDLLFEVLIDCGLDLSAPVSVEQVDGREVLVVDGGALIACLARDLSPAVVLDIALRAPARAVFLDAGFAADADRINASQVFARVSPGTEVKTI
ncbi:MAG TPA: site-specific DNA-methyltransferase [Trebonia sp.]|jgi:adenine-specific DNA-methyltransferase